jgi:hypothetical protein
LTAAYAIRSWQVDAEVTGGHTVQQTLQFIDELEDVEDERPLPMGVISPAGVEPRWLGRPRRWLGR